MTTFSKALRHPESIAFISAIDAVSSKKHTPTVEVDSGRPSVLATNTGEPALNTRDDSLASWLCEMIGEVEGVSAIYVSRDRSAGTPEPVMRVWTVIDNATPEVRREVYDRELRVIQRFSDRADKFDFCTSERVDVFGTEDALAWSRDDAGA